MIIELDPATDRQTVAELCARLAVHDDVVAWPVSLARRSFLAIAGDEILVPDFEHPAIHRRHSTADRGYWLIDREQALAPRTLRVADATVGDGSLWWVAGPCALESIEDAVATGRAVRMQGAHAFRAGLFKPRTSPYNFQGKGLEGIEPLREVKAAVGLPVVTEVLDPRDVAPLAEVADCLQVGTRNMTNQALLKELGTSDRPVLLKRGARVPVEEWLRAAEFVVAYGNPNVILCARGVVSFDSSLRFMPDFGAVLAARRRTALPIVFDPSHAAGRRDAVPAIALAAAAFGVDGLMIEAHVAPERMHEPGDGPQALHPDRLGALIDACAAVRETAADFVPRLDG